MILNLKLHSGLQVSNRHGGSLSLRFTHRLSIKERQKRMDFVRHKVVNRMIEIFMLATKISMRRGPMIPARGIAYRRGRIKVDGIVLAADMILLNPEFGTYRKLFKIFWSILTPIKLAKRQVHFLGRMLGANCLIKNKISYTEHLYKEAISWLMFRKSFRDIQPWKRDTVKRIGFKDFFSFMNDSHPMFLVLIQWFRKFIEIQGKLAEYSGDIIEWHKGRSDIKESTAKAWFPGFNLELLGDRALTRRQIEALNGRKLKVEALYLWHLLFATKAIVREINLTATLRLVAHFSLTDFFLYVTRVDVTVKENGDVRVKHNAPSAIQAIEHLEIWRTPKIQPMLMPGRLLHIRHFLSFPDRVLKKNDRTLDSWIDSFFKGS